MTTITNKPRTIRSFLYSLGLGLLLWLALSIGKEYVESRVLWPISCGQSADSADYSCLARINAAPFLITNTAFFTQDGQIIRANGKDLQIFGWGGPGFAELLSHPAEIMGAKISPERNKIAACINNREGEKLRAEIWVWNIQSRSVIHKINSPTAGCFLVDIEFGGDDFLLVSDVNNAAILFNLNTGEQRQFAGSRARISSTTLAFRSGPRSLATTSLSDLGPVETIPVDLEAKDYIADLTFSRDGRYLAMHSEKGELFVWQVDGWQLLYKFSVTGVMPERDAALHIVQTTCPLTFSDDARRIGACYALGHEGEAQNERQGYVVVWTLGSEKPGATLDFGANAVPESLELGADGSQILLSVEKSTLVYSEK